MSLSDLPTEVLELVYADLDTTALYAISQLCRHLHYTALSRLFQRVRLHENILKDGVLILTPTSPDSTADRHLILAAIRSSLFLDEIHAYKIGVSANVKDVFLDLRGVLEIMKKMTRCSTLEVAFAALSKKLLADQADGKREQLAAEEWKDTVLGLIEEAVKKGCKDLRILDGGPLSKFYSKRGTRVAVSNPEALETPSKGVTPSLEKKGNWFTRTFTLKRRFRNNLAMNLAAPRRMLSARTHRSSPSSKVSQTNLTSCVFRQELFFLPPFITWTTHTLNHSPCLTSLTFVSQPLLPADWSRFLRGITCPALAELRFRGINISFKDLSVFLRRHNAKLRILELTPGDGFVNPGSRALEVDSDWSATPKRGGSAGDPPPVTGKEFTATMPMLEEITTIPIYFVWLMNQPLTLPPSSPRPSFDSYILASPAFTYREDGSPPSPTKEAPSFSSLSLSLDVRFPKFRELTLMADAGKRTAGKDFALAERAFQVLALHIASFKLNGSECQSPFRTLTLSCPTDQSSLKPFFKNHPADASRQLGRPTSLITVTARSSSYKDRDSDATTAPITSSLEGIRTFRLNIPKYQEFMSELFAFVKGFPDVEVLEIVGMPLEAGLKRLLRSYGGMIVNGSKWLVGMREECMDFLD